MKKRLISSALLLALVMALSPTSLAANDGYSNFTKVRTYGAETFQDVASSAWYYSSVKNAYEMGLVSGTSTSTYSPNGSITIAETLALACRLHSIYFNDGYVFNTSSPWYQCYVDYANENGILCPSNNYTKTATRTEFAYILSSSIPQSAFTKINNITDIPDVSSSNYAIDRILMLYNAGILAGSDKYGSFKPDTSITRSEVSAIVTRIADPTLRTNLTLEPMPNVTIKAVGCSDDIQYVVSDLSFDYYTNSIGNVEYYGIVGIKNTGNTPIYMKNCIFDLEDKNGHLLQSNDMVSNAPSWIAPGDTGYFYNSLGTHLNNGISLENGLKLVAQITLKKATSKPVEYSVSDVSLQKIDSSEKFKITGRVTNHTEKDQSYLYLNIILFDDVGNAIGISGTSVTDLYAGATVSFDWSAYFINENIAYEDVHSFKVIAQDEYYQWD